MIRTFKNILFLWLLLGTICVEAQQRYTFNRQDSLRGMLSPLRTCYDVTFYNLNVRINPTKKYIQGYNEIFFKVIEDFDKMQVDLFENLQIDSVIYKGKRLPYEREGNVVYVYFNNKQLKGSQCMIKFCYSGVPVVSVNPPWDGGFVWQKDSSNYDWVGVACEGRGASLWWPCKDHLSDEPDSMSINIESPVHLYCVSNGNIRKRMDLDDGYARHEWFVSYPINNYDVTINIGKYAIISEKHKCIDGDTLPLNYYVLRYNLEKAKKHFSQIPKMLECYEKFFGKYPFKKDGFALVEAPFWGMEHQEAIAYGNHYKNNDFGFDYIVVHESAHEYFGNAITCKDHAELWIHEAFATYAEVLFVEYTQGKPAAQLYLNQMKEKIRNKEAILGPLNVNYHGWQDADMYYKGAWMLHTLRSVIDNDVLWFNILLGMSKDFKFKNVDTKQVVDYFNKKTILDLSNIFDVYLKNNEIPTLIYKLKQKGSNVVMKYKWKANKNWFRMPFKISFGENIDFRIYPTSNWNTEVFRDQDVDNVKLSTDLFYVNAQKIH